MKLMMVLLVILCGNALADVMNLNEFMPTRMEDASVINEKTWDAQFTSSFSEDHSSDQVTNRPNVRYGMTKQLQLDAWGTMLSGGNEHGSGTTSVGALYQFNESKTLTPLIAIKPVIHFPTGKKTQGQDLEYKLILTADIVGTSEDPITQFHFNFRHIYNDDPYRDERTNRFMYVVGVSNKISPLTALLLDMVLEEKIRKGETSNILEVGIHHDLGGGLQLGASIGGGMGQDSPSWTSNLGLEKRF